MLNPKRLDPGILLALLVIVSGCSTMTPPPPATGDIAVIALKEGHAARQAYQEAERELGALLSSRGATVYRYSDVAFYAHKVESSSPLTPREQALQAARFHPALARGEILFFSVAMQAVGDPGQVVVRAERFAVSDGRQLAASEAVQPVALSDNAQHNRASWQAAIRQACGEVMKTSLPLLHRK
ncbi:hypothetical protein HCU74_00785 [Spongiibacter sp. KMU-166]|uniref:Lipopolysaccharide-assembly n=1 Tax=Spongiibacter thalassae TaxID=2721624 RepID=A0ABX1GAG2_9GAMM|nr:hypothetical protein [Spongiibacter thalassae]NKI15941.1 hypothetical protein [Spongiibacter thalassae]